MKNNNFWLMSLKVFMMSAFASIISFMLNCLIVIMGLKYFHDGDAIPVRIIMQVVGLFVEFIFIYGTLWDVGNTDAQRISVGEGEYSIFRGVQIGFVSAIPYYLTAAAMMLMSFKVLPDITGFLRVCCSQFWGIYTFLLPVEKAGSTAVSEITIAKCIATPAQAISAVFVPTIIPILSYLPYYLGRKKLAVGEKIFLKGNKKGK